MSETDMAALAKNYINILGWRTATATRIDVTYEFMATPPYGKRWIKMGQTVSSDAPYKDIATTVEGIRRQLQGE